MPVNPPFTQRLLRPPHKWGRLLVALLPVTVLGIWLKMYRIGAFFPGADAWQTTVSVASDVAFGTSWVLLWVALAAYGPSWLRTLNFYLAHLATGVLGIFLIVNHEFMLRTGTPLTLDRLVYGWENREGLNELIGSQMNAVTIGLLVGVLLSVSVLPLLLGRYVSSFLVRRPRPAVRRLGVVSAVALLVASFWTAPSTSAAFSLAAPVQFAVAEVRESAAYPDHLAPAGELPDLAATTLDPRTDERRNLVVIMLESQRATSTLPPTREPVTPVLDALEAESLTVTRAYTVLPHTSKAVTAIHCGVAPPLDSENTEADDEGLPARCLPELLAEQGYRTAFFQSATENFERRRSTVRNLGFDYFRAVDSMDKQGYHKANYFGYEDDIMLPHQREWLEQNADRGPFMLSMLTVTAHHDYVLQGYEKIDFVDDPMFNEYLNSVHYQDRFVGKVLDQFRDLGLYDDTVFVIVADHGEGFGEHRVYQHDNTIYEEGARVPLLIHDPQRAGEVVEGPVSQAAILPTAVDALGFDLQAEYDYKPSLYSGEEQGPVIATCFARALCTTTLDGDLKLIHHFGDRRDEVYNIAEDPFELNDLADTTDPAWMAEQRDHALRWYLEWETVHERFRQR